MDSKGIAESLPLNSNPEPSTSTKIVSLDSKTASMLSLYGRTIKYYAKRYDLDWRLILAVMRQESNFITDAESRKGAFGLMQIMPHTGDQVADELGVDGVIDPHNNILAGIYYFRKLYRKFEGVSAEDRIKLTLAAYNAGMGRILDAQDIARYLNDNPRTWQSVKNALPLLSKRYSTLHKNVWNEEKPKNGYYAQWQQTIRYVQNITEYYDEYRKCLQ